MDTTEEEVFYLTVTTRNQMTTGRVTYDRVAGTYIYTIEKTNLANYNPPVIIESGQGTEVTGMISSILVTATEIAESVMQTHPTQ